MRSINSFQLAPFTALAVMAGLLSGACDRTDSNATARLSGVGESCLRTSDCVESAKCVEQRCTLSTASAEVPAAQASGVAAAQEAVREPAPVPAPSAPAEPEYKEEEPCTHVGHMLGTWSFTSLGILADEPDKGAVNGYYRVFIERAMDCTVNATITKTGFGRHTFTPEKYQVGDLSLDPMGGGAAIGDTYGGAVTIIRKDGSARVDMSFSFRFEGDTLKGVWHYLGDSWNTMNMTGELLGRRSASDRPSLPSIESVGRPLACVAYACTPRVNGARGGFDCGHEYDRCVSSRESLSTFSTTSQGTMRAAAVEQVSKGRSLSGVGKALVSSFAKNDYSLGVPGAIEHGRWHKGGRSRERRQGRCGGDRRGPGPVFQDREGNQCDCTDTVGCRKRRRG